jgi:trans-aconitate 2-methyltransferase
MWSPDHYIRFRGERSRPFFDLVAQVDRARDGVAPRTVADLGCGTGDLTATLAERWPGAHVWGVDSSAEMVGAAARHRGPRLEISQDDLARWQTPAPLDVVVANASLQWVPAHDALLGRLAAALAPGGVLGFQVPANFDQPSHLLLERVRSSPRWAARIGACARAAIESPGTYLEILSRHGLLADVWETTYWHVLDGEDPVLRWTEGTALRPLLAELDETEATELRAEYGALVRQAYPQAAYGTPFPFRRLFAVARRSG